MIHPGALGDVLLARPALAHLRALGYERTLAAAARVADLLAGTGCVETTCDLDSLGLHRLFAGEAGWAAPEALVRHDAVVSWMGAGDDGYRTRLLSLARPVVVARSVPPPDDPRHASEHLLASLAPLGPLAPALPLARLGAGEAIRGRANRGRGVLGGGATRGVPPPARLRPDPAEVAAVLAWLGERGVGEGEAVVLHPGAGSPAKRWPGFAELAGWLGARGHPVVLTTGPADDDLRAALDAAPRAAGALVARAADWPLRRLAALFAHARAFVGNDSGPTHLAAAVGCPTVAVFGPTDAGRWQPLGERVAVVTDGPPPGAGWTRVPVARVAAALAELGAT